MSGENANAAFVPDSPFHDENHTFDMISELHKSAVESREVGSSGAPIHGIRKGLIAVVAACCALAFLVSAQSPISEYSVKAAYLFNFGKFVRFTPSDGQDVSQTFDICVVGEDPLGHSLDELTANEKLDGKPVRVARFKSAAEARDCRIVYISAAEGSRVDGDLGTLNGHQVLTVSDSSDFLKRGGVIQFMIVAKHVRFAVNLDAARQAHLSLSSELLKVAISVTGNASSEGRR